MKQRLKKLLPAAVWQAGSDAYWAYRNRGRHRLAQLGPAWSRNVHALQSLRDVHAGQRCFIIGNGPSLRRTELSLLKDEFTFGLNRIYLLFPELGFQTSCLVSVNELVLEQCAGEIKGLSIPKYITWRARKWFRRAPGTLFLDTDYTGAEDFSGDACGRLFEGFTVTYVALQLAFHMGFTDVLLVGVDHSFTTRGQANSTVISTGADPNHFAANYFGPGFRWQLPDLDGSERAYRLAQAAYQRAGRQVRDATVGGKLDIFPKVPYASLFPEGQPLK